MVVEDDEDVRALVVDSLATRGFDVLVAGDVFDRLFQAQPHRRGDHQVPVAAGGAQHDGGGNFDDWAHGAFLRAGFS